MNSAISESIWMWIVGGACGLALLLCSVIGGFILNSIIKIKEEIKLFRLEFTENKGETMTWEKFAPVKRDMEKDRAQDIKIAMAEHNENFDHAYKTV